MCVRVCVCVHTVGTVVAELVPTLVYAATDNYHVVQPFYWSELHVVEYLLCEDLCI